MKGVDLTTTRVDGGIEMDETMKDGGIEDDSIEEKEEPTIVKGSKKKITSG